MEKKTIYTKLLSIQTEVDSFVKSAKAFNYNYVDGNQVLEAIRPLMVLNKLILKQEVTKCENTIIDYKTKSAEKREVLSSVSQRFTWVDCETGETDVNEFHANGMNDFDKGLGSALTYAERYFLLKYFHIPTDKDDPDAQKPREQQPPTKQLENNLPWLNEGTDEYKKIADRLALKDNKGTIQDVLKIHKMNAKVKAALELIIIERNKK